MVKPIKELQKFVHQYTSIEVVDPNHRSHGENRYDLVDLVVNVHSDPDIKKFVALLDDVLIRDTSFDLFRGRSKGINDVDKWIGKRIMGQCFMALFPHFGFGNIKNPYVDSKDKGPDAAARLSRGMNAPRIEPTADGKRKYMAAIINEKIVRIITPGKNEPGTSG